MAFTGILGTQYAQPGTLVPGAGPGRSPSDNSESVTSAVTVADAIVSHDTGDHLSAADSAAVAPTIGVSIQHGRGDVQSVTSTVTVTPTIAHHGAISQAVTSTIAVAPTLGGRDDHDRQSVTSSISVAATIPSVTVSHGGNVSVSVADVVGVAQVCFGRNTNVRIVVTTAISVATPAGGRDAENRQSVADAIAVGPAYPPPARPYITPRRARVTDFATVVDAVGGGGPTRDVSVVDTATVADAAASRPLKFAVADVVTVADAIGGGSSSRTIPVAAAVVVASDAAGRDGTNRQAIRDALLVLHARDVVALTSVVRLVVADAVRVDAAVVARSANHQSVSDAATVHAVVSTYARNNRQAVRDVVTVGQAQRSSTNHQVVVSTAVVSTRLTNFDQVVVSRVHVAATLLRDHDGVVVDTVPIVEVVGRQATRPVALVDALSIVESTSRGVIWARSPVDVVTIPDRSFQRPLEFAGTTIDVPVAVGTLVSNTTALKSKKAIITLPAPQLGDGRDNVAKTIVQRSMNGGTIVFKQSSARQRLKYAFRLDAIKAWELRAFLQDNLSELLTLTTWDAQVWAVYVTSDPFEAQNAGRSYHSGKVDGPDEFSTIELEFEGTKLSG